MPERYVEAILKYMADREYQPLKPRQLARWMGVSREDYGTFRAAVKSLRDSGHVVLGGADVLMLPEMPGRVVGFFRQNPKGFGFVVPESPNAHGDLFIPPEAAGGAVSGDLVVARAKKRGRRDGQVLYRGRIVEILKRGRNRFVGQIRNAEGTWFVLPDGKQMTTPIVVKDVGKAGPKAGQKVVVEIVRYPEPGQLPTGVIVEELGPAGPLEVETRAVILAHGLSERFSDGVLADARAAAEAFDASDREGREDLTGWTIVTIDPDTARDFDDAISLTKNGDGTWELGVHIADVSHFVAEGTALDAEARSRGNSTYFPRRVLPMLPEILSNGVCSLQEGRPRFCKSALITYDDDGRVVGARLAETVISSTRRLTYAQAQSICDGDADFEPNVVEVVRNMEVLARRIEARRRSQGMLHLDLPEVELVLDDNDKVADVQPEESAYTHTIIEMFMVEANEAVARLFGELERPILRRIHPGPDSAGTKQFSAFVRAAGHKISKDLTRDDMQKLLESVRGKPESYAVNMALLKIISQAEYSPMQVGHFALASKCYCHFTSPIRRYPDLTVHRLLGEYCRGRLETRPPEDVPALVELGEHCTAAEQRSEAAERELNKVLVLQLLSGRIGEVCQGVITGVMNFGIFVQLPRYGIDGLVRVQELGDDWWEVNVRRGEVRGQRTGRKFRIGDLLAVHIAAVDVPGRQLDLIPHREPGTKKKRKSRKKK